VRRGRGGPNLKVNINPPGPIMPVSCQTNFSYVVFIFICNSKRENKIKEKL